MERMICSPGCYVQGEGELKKLASLYQQLGTKGVYLIVDKFIYDTYQADIESSFKEAGIPFADVVFGGECSTTEIDKHVKALGNHDVVIGIGGGKTLDTAKAVSYYAHIPVMIVPTAASSDAPCSRLSVVYKETGEFDKYLPLSQNPQMVVMDTTVVAGAPARFLMAGIGDALATYYEAAACVQSEATIFGKSHATKAALTLAKLCHDTLLADGRKAKAAVEAGAVTQAVENIIEANTYLSGIGFESCGLAAAHAIHDGMTILPQTHKLLHGEKVAFGAISQLVMENRSEEELREIITFCRDCGLPTTFKELGIEAVTDDQLLEVAKLSCDAADTMGNMPFTVTPAAVVSAMKAADAISRKI